MRRGAEYFGASATEANVPSDLPRLVTFHSSHFCEKARWALDWHRVAYDEVCWPVGVHTFLAKWHGAPRTTVPMLICRDGIIQGSGAIIDWADQRSEMGASLSSAETRAIEERADAVVGTHVRRLCYAEMLPSTPGSVKKELFRDTSVPQRLLANAMWPVTRRIMLRAMDINPRAASESRDILERELDRLDNVLADRRTYLVGTTLTRADIAIASLLAPFARPEEMPAFYRYRLSERLLADAARWQARPTMKWIVAQYRRNRRARALMPPARRRPSLKAGAPGGG